MNDLITNGEAKTDEPYIPSLDRIENKLSYFIGKLVEHHIQRAMDDLKMGEPIDITPERLTHLETAVKDLKARVQTLEEDLVSADTVNDIINERLDERDAERNDAEDASEYVKIEDLADAVRDCFHNGEVTFNVDVS
tara:strand:+ start:124 stop:534 length:411 start_codon:yes stop_codon:yes gene_type:complete